MKTFKAKIFYFLIFLVVLGFSFRLLIPNLSSNLHDWYDYPFIVWVINSNLDRFVSLNFSRIFDTNILYPHPNNLLLTDTLFTQAILGLPIRLFSTNPILIFNFIFISTFILNYIASFLLWGRLFKKDSLSFLGSTLMVFSPYLHSERWHFQLVSYWPSFLALYFLYKYEEQKRLKQLILAGVFLTMQFFASVYLSVFLLAAICLYFVVQTVVKREIWQSLKNFTIVLTTFLIISSPAIIGYINVQKQFNVQRDYGEYVFYSAHLSDYLFTREVKSVIHTLPPLQKWNSFNRHFIGGVALSPGFFLIIFATLGIFSKLKKDKPRDLFFLTLLIISIVFSFGPRANFNGAYAEIPLPYHFVLKYVPFIDVVRAPYRWVFLLYPALIYFSLKFISQRALKKGLLVLFSAFILLEYVPLSINFTSENYLKDKDTILKEICANEPKVVLEIPVTHFDAGRDILEGLNYITKTILSSGYHRCKLVNGYGSYDLPSVSTLTNSLYDTATKKDSGSFLKLLESNNIQYIVVNSSYLKNEDKAKSLETMVNSLKVRGDLLDKKYGVYEVRVPEK